jgi:hypothetical protein
MRTINLRAATSISVNQSRELLDATVWTEPDPAWTYIDPAGHKHHWTKSFKLPTLDRVIDAWGVDEDGESYVAADHYECRRCRAHVRPGMQPGKHREIAGIRSWSAEVTLPHATDLTEAIAALYENELCEFQFEGGTAKGYVTSVMLGGPFCVSIRGIKEPPP